MKLKENFKRFWTLSKNRKGFTLVELIVVIAILAILAGVAIPVYNGYIKKAETAGDQQLADAINTAFAAACISNGGIQEVAAKITIDADGRFYTTDAEGNADYSNNIQIIDQTADATAILEDFAMFFKGNNGVFKSDAFKDQTFDMPIVEGAGAEGGAKMQVTFNGKKFEISLSAIDAFKNATVFSENIEQMQGQVGKLSNAYGGIVGLFSTEQLGLAFGSDYTAYLEAAGAGGDPTKIGNATVLYVAEKSADMTADDAYNRLKEAATYLQTNAGNNPTMTDFLAAAGSTGDPLATTAMMYGAVTAYANSGTNETLKNQVANVNDAVTLMEVFQSAAADPNFYNYVGTESATNQFTTDISGYLGVLDAMGTVSEGVDLGNSGVWTSDEIDALLGQLMG